MVNPLETSDVPLETKLSHAFARLGVVQRANSWEATGEAGLNPTQGTILGLLYRNASAMRLGEIADALAVSAATVSDSVSVLVDKGLIAKRKAKDDGRAVAISLLVPGRRFAEQLNHGDDVLIRALGALEDDEREQLFLTLLKMIRQLQVSGHISVNRACVTCRYFRPKVHNDGQRPHHCALVDSSFGDKTIREDCPEHEAADKHLAEQNWRVFSGEA